MSKFQESDEYDPKRFVKTDKGFALAQEAMPSRHDVIWKKMPEGHIYFWNDDEWVRFSPPEERKLPGGIKHG